MFYCQYLNVWNRFKYIWDSILNECMCTESEYFCNKVEYPNPLCFYDFIAHKSTLDLFHRTNHFFILCVPMADGASLKDMSIWDCYRVCPCTTISVANSQMKVSVLACFTLLVTLVLYCKSSSFSTYKGESIAACCLLYSFWFQHNALPQQ